MSDANPRLGTFYQVKPGDPLVHTNARLRRVWWPAVTSVLQAARFDHPQTGTIHMRWIPHDPNLCDAAMLVWVRVQSWLPYALRGFVGLRVKPCWPEGDDEFRSTSDRDVFALWSPVRAMPGLEETVMAEPRADPLGALVELEALLERPKN